MKEIRSKYRRKWSEGRSNHRYEVKVQKDMVKEDLLEKNVVHVKKDMIKGEVF